MMPSHARYHWDNLQSTRHNFLRTRDRRIGFALLGSELAFKGGIEPDHLSYANPLLQCVFEPYAHFDASQLERECRRVSMRGFGFLPGELRRLALISAFRLRALANLRLEHKTSVKKQVG